MKEKLQINGMHCASCAMLIDDELEEVSGVRASDTSYARQLTQVQFDENQVGVSDLVAKIAELGYHAEPARD